MSIMPPSMQYLFIIYDGEDFAIVLLQCIKKIFVTSILEFIFVKI